MSDAVAPLLSLEDVHVTVGSAPILRGVSLALGPGEALALAGPNGAGKTTLLRAATGVAPLARGRVCLGGTPLDQLAPRARARCLAVVPQDIALVFPFTVAELVLMGRAPHLPRLGFETRDDVAAARAAMERVGVEHLADRSVLEISGGERQLVLFARALAQAAQVLLLDEPTAHLDLQHRLRLLDQVQQFVAAGGSALVVSHDLGLAARSCGRAALLAEGRLVAEGDPAEVFAPSRLREVFRVEAELLSTADGAPVIVARRPAVGDPDVPDPAIR
ncbi:MAG: ABC transporter ATP-binding protein [Deltaproteobacteria bacterium]|nr:ABC transporter ATP-binding protein [Deltaproteobacteria bacterium]MBW2360787.1 ABC transporter ATP-binding protein [Deltaproteobacteria bacterium]